ncbi:hypothetical protein D041_4073B, partial [Vibrio parahaemolyticus EKP-008]
VMSSPDAVV